MTVLFQKLNPAACLPRHATLGSAGYDLCACIEQPLTVKPGQTVPVPTGLAMEIPAGYAGLIYARSGIAVKRGLAPANKVGVIDADYRGEILVALYNQGTEPQSIEHGERIAQMIVTPYLTADFVQADQLSDTVRGEGGFGSTGRI